VRHHTIWSNVWLCRRLLYGTATTAITAILGVGVAVGVGIAINQQREVHNFGIVIIDSCGILHSALLQQLCFVYLGPRPPAMMFVL
jgi:hypothetical protein